MTLPIPNTPIVNAPYLSIQGLRLAFLTGTTISVALGRARDGTNTNDIILSAGVTINAAVNGVINGLDTGALAASTLYAVYLVGSSTNSAPSGALLSTSFTSPSLPYGYDMCRRIGAVLTSGASAIRDFTQAGFGQNRDTWYADAIATPITAGAATSFTAVVCTGFVPGTAGEIFFESILTADAGATRTLALRATGSSSVAGQVITSSPASTVSTSSLRCPCATIAGVVSSDYLVSNAAAATALNVFGYQEQL